MTTDNGTENSTYMNRKNIIIGAVAIVIIVAGVVFIGRNKVSAPTEQAILETATKDWGSFESGTYDSTADVSTLYTIAHPKEFVVSKRATARGGFLKNPLITFAFPKDAFAEPKSTFGEGYATVSSSKSKNTDARCFAKLEEATGEFVDADTWNGATFKRADIVDPGAGNIYTSRVYRTLFDGTCYEVALTVRTTSLANYEAGTVVEFDKEQAFSVLENIRKTFSLRKEDGPMK